MSKNYICIQHYGELSIITSTKNTNKNIYKHIYYQQIQGLLNTSAELSTPKYY